MRRAALPLLFLGLAAPAARAGVGAAGGQILREPLAVRPAALGEAWTAVAGGVDSLGDNPAGLAAIGTPQAAGMGRTGIAGDTFVAIAGGGPLMGFGVGGAIGYLSAGSVEALDPTGRTTLVNAEQDLLVQAGGAWSFAPLPVAAGASLEMVRSTLLEDAAATDFAANVGARADLPAGLGLGLALQHWGGHLRYDAEKEPIDNNALPVTVRCGASWDTAIERTAPVIGSFSGERTLPPHRLRLVAAVADRVREHTAEYGLGAELLWADRLALRTGYRLVNGGVADRHSVVSLGLGAMLGSVRFDYAAELLSVATVHRAGLTFVTPPEPTR